MNEQMKMEILRWAQEVIPATAGLVLAELRYQYSDEVEVDSPEMEASMEREANVWRCMAKGFAGYLFNLRKEADAYALYAVEVAEEYDVQPTFDNLKDMVEWHVYSR